MSSQFSEHERADTLDHNSCPACGHVNGLEARFCASCGLSLLRDSHNPPPPMEHVADPLIGRVIADRYKIVELLGRGGMGVVYKVEHVHILKLMAMKLLHGELARDRDTVKRFKREAEAASRLSHPNTVQIFDFDRDQGLMYLVMEYLEGRDFGWYIQHEGPLPLARVARICAQVCSSVGEAHEKGVIHRDLKPENVMVLSPDERRRDIVKVLDFGLAKLRQEDAGLSLTRAGAIIGTPYYMAPEHIRGEPVDPRADIYSVGAMMYKGLTGVPPFWASTPMGVLTKHLTDEVIPPSERAPRAQLPPEADAIVLKAMEKDPADRYQDMAEFGHDLVAYLDSIGEDLGESGLSLPSGISVESPSGRRIRVQVATRTDVDRYERRLERKGWVGRILLMLLVIGIGVGGWYGYTRFVDSPSVPNAETEPNDSLELANELPPAVTVTGYLGRRQSEVAGDADIYVIRNPGGPRRPISFEVTALPNMDLVVDVVKAGNERPVMVANSGEINVPEGAPNFPLSGPTYYLRVRENQVGGAPPTENVSDTYTIRWDFVSAGDGEEAEINDSLELATALRPGEPIEGYIGWEGDVDTYCLAEDGANLVASVSGVEGLDLVLRVVDRRPPSSRAIDDNGVGEGERSAPIARGETDETCFEVSASEAGVNRAERYRLQVSSEGG